MSRPGLTGRPFHRLGISWTMIHKILCLLFYSIIIAYFLGKV